MNAGCGGSARDEAVGAGRVAMELVRGRGRGERGRAGHDHEARELRAARREAVDDRGAQVAQGEARGRVAAVGRACASASSASATSSRTATASSQDAGAKSAQARASETSATR